MDIINKKLNLPHCRLRISENGDVRRVLDPVRGCWLVLTDEEWVRRHVIAWLTDHMGVSALLISQEHPVAVQGMKQRADVVVFGSDGKAVLLVECKAPEVAVDASVYAQAVRYNAVLAARYLMITNGIRHFIYERTESGDYVSLKSLADMNI